VFACLCLQSIIIFTHRTTTRFPFKHPKMPPKTPSRQRVQSESAKTPLTPSIISGMNNVFVSSPTKPSGKTTKYSQADTTNPFITRASSRTTSRAPSPVKRATSGAFPVSDSLQRQAGAGVIRKGGIESKLNVISRDYVPPQKSELKRSRSTPAPVNVSHRFEYSNHLA
jgi:cell division cycle 20, cofactor of APC complex